MSSVQELVFETLAICGEMEVYNVGKSHVCIDAVVQTSNWSRDDSTHVETLISTCYLPHCGWP